MPGYKVKGKSQVQIQPKSPIGDTKQVPEVSIPSITQNQTVDNQSDVSKSTSNLSRPVARQQETSQSAGNVDKKTNKVVDTKTDTVKKVVPAKISDIISGKDTKKSPPVSPLAKINVEIVEKQGKNGDKNLAGPAQGLGLDKLDIKKKKDKIDRTSQQSRTKVTGRNYTDIRPDRLIDSLISADAANRSKDDKPMSDDALNSTNENKTKPGDTSQPERNEIDNVIQLPLSVKDKFLYDRGINSSFPSLILTTKKIKSIPKSKVSVSEMFIKMNNTIKFNVENTSLSLIKSSPVSDDIYTRNADLMKAYAQLCLNTASSKDDFIKLLNIYNTPLAPTSAIIGKLPYTAFDDIENVRDYVSNWALYYPKGIEVTSSNTQLILQFFKNFFMTYLYGGISYNKSGYPPGTTNILGKYTYGMPGIADGLKRISASSTTTSTNLLNPNPVFDTSLLDGIEGQALAANFIVRDLVINAQQTSLQSIQNGNNITESLGNLIGVYYSDELAASADVSGGIANLEDFMQYNRKGKIRNIFLRRENSATIGLLDADKSSTSQYRSGLDVLINDDLLKLSSDPSAVVDLTTAKSFINDYKNLCADITNFYNKSRVDPNASLTSDKSDLFVGRIKNHFYNWINATKLSAASGARDNKNSFIRSLMLFRAAAPGQQNFSLNLFRLMCVNDKLSQGGLPENTRTQLVTEQNTVVETIIRLMCNPTTEAGVSYSSNGGLAAASTLSGESITEFILDSQDLRNNSLNVKDVRAALTQAGTTSFLISHKAARDIELDFGFRRDVNFTNCNLKTSSYGGLSLNTDARAFVIYKIFLSMLSNTKYNVSVSLVNSTTAKAGDSGADPEKQVIKKWKLSLTYTPMNFSAIKFALENYLQTPSDFNRFVDSILSSPAIGTSVVSGKDILTSQKKNVKIYHGYFRRITDKIIKVDRDLFSVVQLFNQHQQKLNVALDRFEQSNLILVHNFIRENNIFDSSKLINDVQLEQAKLKSIISNRYAKTFKYLPSITDYTRDQTDRLKPCLLPNARFFPSGENVQYVVVGLPTGMLENMRYKNAYDVNESIFEIELIVKGLQVDQKNEKSTRTSSLKYKFSSNIFVNDYIDPKIVKYNKVKDVFDSTNLVEIRKNEIRPIDAAKAAKSYGSDVIINHLVSYYSGLIMKSVYGLSVDENIFDLINREISYPDSTLRNDYLELFKTFMTVSNFTDTPENSLFIQRVMNDVARSINYAPNEHFVSATSTKLFDRVLVLPVNFSSFKDLKFLNVMLKINLLPNLTART